MFIAIISIETLENTNLIVTIMFQTTTPNGCFNVKMEEEVNFSIVVKVDQCNAEGNNTYNFDIEVIDNN